MSSSIGLPGPTTTTRASDTAEPRAPRSADRASRSTAPSFTAVLERTLRHSRDSRAQGEARSAPEAHGPRDADAAHAMPDDDASRESARPQHDAASTAPAEAHRDSMNDTEHMLLATRRSAHEVSRATPTGTPAAVPTPVQLPHVTASAGAIATNAPPPATPAAQPTPPQPVGEVEERDGAAVTSGTRAEASAASAATSAGPAKVSARGRAERNTVERSTDELVPELRDRLERVVARMQAEYGVQVQVVETLRSQARQDALHAQGRSAPGPVVTWTRHSRHSEGRAVDVMLNGGYDDAAAFTTLQRVAREEGLQTLGARDPGHMELSGSLARGHVASGGESGKTVDFVALRELVAEAGASIDELRVTDREPAAARPASTVARSAAHSSSPAPGAIARVAAVAPLARVATVATVARVARPGAAGRATGATASPPAGAGAARAEAVAADRPRAAAAEHQVAVTTPAPAAAIAAARGQMSASMRRDGTATGEQRDDAAATPLDATGRAELLAAEPAPLPGRGAMHDRQTAAIAGTSATDALARLDHIAELRDGAAARPLTHLTLTLDGAAGKEDRIRVNMRGSQLGAVLELSDAGLRSRVTSHIGELQQALDQRGLDTQALQVRRATMAGPESLDLARVAGATLERENPRTGGNTNFGQSSTPQRGRDERSSSDGSPRDPSFRQRSRREPKGDR